MTHRLHGAQDSCEWGSTQINQLTSSTMWVCVFFFGIFLLLLLLSCVLLRHSSVDCVDWTTAVYFLTVLLAISLHWRCQDVCSLRRPLSFVCTWPPILCVPTWPFVRALLFIRHQSCRVSCHNIKRLYMPERGFWAWDSLARAWCTWKKSRGTRLEGERTAGGSCNNLGTRKGFLRLCRLWVLGFWTGF